MTDDSDAVRAGRRTGKTEMGSPRFYILDENGEPVPAALEQWAAWLETDERMVARDTVGRFLVSTVFLGMRTYGGNLPQWETMIFVTDAGDDGGDYQRRCSRKADVAPMHKVACDLAWRSFVADPSGPLLDDDDDDDEIPVEHS